MSPPCPLPGSSAASGYRTSRTAEYKGLHIVVTASRRITGVTVVSTRVSGGPDNLRRDFYTLSPEADPERACAEAIHAMQRLLANAALPG